MSLPLSTALSSATSESALLCFSEVYLVFPLQRFGGISHVPVETAPITLGSCKYQLKVVVEKHLWEQTLKYHFLIGKHEIQFLNTFLAKKNHTLYGGL